MPVCVQGRCSTPPPASFNLVEPVPPGACAILVEEDFLDVPVGNLVFWLDSVYVAMASPGTSESSVLVLQVCSCPSRVTRILLNDSLWSFCLQTDWL